MMIATVDADEPLGGPEISLETLNLCWWNTRLAPPCTSRKAKTAPKSRFAKAVEVIAAYVGCRGDISAGVVIGIGQVCLHELPELLGAFRAPPGS